MEEIMNVMALKIHRILKMFAIIRVADTVNHCKGLGYILPGKSSPVFIRLPRNNAIAILNNGRSICQAMSMCAMTQRQSLSRGKGTHVFTEGGNKYCCIGSQPGKAERGVQSGLYRMKYGLQCKDWVLAE